MRVRGKHGKALSHVHVHAAHLPARAPKPAVRGCERRGMRGWLGRPRIPYRAAGSPDRAPVRVQRLSSQAWVNGELVVRSAEEERGRMLAKTKWV